MPAYLVNAYASGAIVAILAATVGYFVVVRRAAFATHALSQIGFAGAAGAVLLGIEPLAGLLTFAVGGALVLGALERRRGSNDVTIALVLVAALGTGALFLALERDYASNAFALLFGTIVGVDRAQVGLTALAAALGLLALASVARPLLFASVTRDAAQAAGVPVHTLDVVFLLIVAVAAAITVPIVGTLLVFALTLGPVAAAARLGRGPVGTIALGIALALAAALGGIALADATGWPVGFYVATLAFAEYAGAYAWSGRSAGNARDCV